MTVTNTDVYTNPDGLKIRFGTGKAKAALVGSPSPRGRIKELVAILDYSRFAPFGETTVIDEMTSAVIPAGALITKATFIPTTAFVGSGATLTIGTYKTDGTTVLDEDGIDATIAVTAIDAVGEQVACDGAQVAGVAITFDAYVSALVGTANFTAGRGELIIEYIMPE